MAFCYLNKELWWLVPCQQWTFVFICASLSSYCRLQFKKVCGLSQLVCSAWETDFWCTCTICLAGVFEDGSEQKCHEERSSVQDSRTRWEARWEARHFFMYRYRTFTAPFHPSIWLFLKVISKSLFLAFQYNLEVYKFISAAVDLFDWFICWDL